MRIGLGPNGDFCMKNTIQEEPVLSTFENTQDTDQTAARTHLPQYTKPLLTQLGDIRGMTLAPSFGSFESGPGNGHRA